MRTRMSYFGRTNERKSEKTFIRICLRFWEAFLNIYNWYGCKWNTNQIGVKKSEFIDKYG